MRRTQEEMNEVARSGKEHYAKHIRKQVETEENIGKLVIIDVLSGDYEFDEDENRAADRLYTRHPDGHMYRIRIGYRSVATFGGMMERTTL